MSGGLGLLLYDLLLFSPPFFWTWLTFLSLSLFLYHASWHAFLISLVLQGFLESDHEENGAFI
jgi:hypothetical protein